MDTVGVVILNYKNWENTIECLESLAYSVDCALKVVIVDNNSGNNSLEHIRVWLDTKNHSKQDPRISDDNVRLLGEVQFPVYLLDAKENLGYAAGNNRGLRFLEKIGVDYCLILNNDVLVQDNAIIQLVHSLQSMPGTGAVGPKIILPNGDLDKNCARNRMAIADYVVYRGIIKFFLPIKVIEKRLFVFSKPSDVCTTQVDILSGACILLRMDTFRSLEFFDERTFLYEEEYILAEKLRKANLKSAIIHTSVVIHKQKMSSSRSSKDEIFSHYLRSLRIYLTAYRDVPGLISDFIILNLSITRSISKAIGKGGNYFRSLMGNRK